MRKVSMKSICYNYLEKKLADGPVAYVDIKNDAASLGLSMTAMRHAANDLDVVSLAVFEFRRSTTWALPQHLTEIQNEAAEW